MGQYALPGFGILNTSNLEEFYDSQIESDNRYIQIELNFEEQTIDSEKLDSVKKILDNLSEIDLRNKGYLKEDFINENGDTVRFYLENYLADIDEADLDSIIDLKNEQIEPEEQLFEKLHLTRIGFYPDTPDEFAVFDYTIGEEFTNNLVVVITDEAGTLCYLTMES